MYCKNCGKNLRENSSFCGNCGANIKELESNKKEYKKMICLFLFCEISSIILTFMSLVLENTITCILIKLLFSIAALTIIITAKIKYSRIKVVNIIFWIYITIIILKALHIFYFSSACLNAISEDVLSNELMMIYLK